MTLRLDAVTAQQLRNLSTASGRSQQQIVHQAVREYIAAASAAVQRQHDRLVEALLIGRVCGPLSLDPAFQNDLSDTLKSELTEEPRLRHPDFLIPSPPGGVLQLLDREDRV